MYLDMIYIYILLYIYIHFLGSSIKPRSVPHSGLRTPALYLFEGHKGLIIKGIEIHTFFLDGDDTFLPSEMVQSLSGLSSFRLP